MESIRDPANGPPVVGQVGLSIVIVNWNSLAYLRKCLATVFSSMDGAAFEVLVVDNASFDGSAEFIAREYPQVHFIQSRENLGFARANNLAVGRSRGRNLLFLNPDTEIVDRAIPLMLGLLESIPDAGAVGCKLLNSDRTVQTSCIQSYPTILGLLLDTDVLRRVFPKWRLWGMRPLFEDGDMPAEVEVISGASVMLRQAVFMKVGGFTADYFMYAEDLDLCCKVKKAGWKNYYTGTATIVHHGGGSTATNPENQFASIMMRESILKFLQLHRGRIYASIHLVATTCVALCRVLVIGGMLTLPVSQEQRRSLRFSFAKWYRLFRWSVGLERWAKETLKSRS